MLRVKKSDQVPRISITGHYVVILVNQREEEQGKVVFTLLTIVHTLPSTHWNKFSFYTDVVGVLW